MKRLILSIGVGILLAGTASATPTTCPQGTYSQYLAPGFTCSSGILIFTNFSYDPNSLVVPASAVMVTPITVSANEGFKFAATNPTPWSVSSVGGVSTRRRSLISFDVNTVVPSILSLQLWFLGSLPTGTGSSMATDTCDPGGFGFSSTCASTSDPSGAVAQAVFFGPVDTVKITNLDIDVISGDSGAAGISQVGLSFTTPEPMSFALVGAGLLALGLLRRKIKWQSVLAGFRGQVAGR